MALFNIVSIIVSNFTIFFMVAILGIYFAKMLFYVEESKRDWSYVDPNIVAFLTSIVIYSIYLILNLIPV